MSKELSPIAEQHSFLNQRPSGIEIGPFSSERGDFIHPRDLFSSKKEWNLFPEKLAQYQARLKEQYEKFIAQCIEEVTGITDIKPYGEAYRTYHEKIQWEVDSDIKNVRTVPTMDVLLEGKARNNIGVVFSMLTRNEADNLPIAITTLRALIASGMVDGAFLVDSSSEDNTVAIAEAAGLPVVKAQEFFEQVGIVGIENSKAANDFIAKLLINTNLTGREGRHIQLSGDPDYNLGPEEFQAIAGPLIMDDNLAHMKGMCVRLTHGGDASKPATSGGRVTELTFKPLLFLFPELDDIYQPLLGCQGYNVDLMNNVPVADLYAVETGHLVDTLMMYGPNAIGQAPIGTVEQVGQKNTDLKKMAEQIVRRLLLAAIHQGIIEVHDPRVSQIFRNQQIETRRHNITTDNPPRAQATNFRQPGVSFPPPALLLRR
jgi:glucosyl-3-phosphoglycerate synthase